jgi:hypothetical protein
MQGQTLDLLAGVALRDIGIQSVYKNNSPWIDQARKTAKRIFNAEGVVSIDEVLAECPRPAHVHKNATGSVFREKCWVRVGYKPSANPSAHARVIGIYTLIKEPS